MECNKSKHTNRMLLNSNFVKSWKLLKIMDIEITTGKSKIPLSNWPQSNNALYS